MRLYTNILRPRQNGRHFADIFKCIFLNENVCVSIKISLIFVPNGLINYKSSLVQIMACRLLVQIMAWCRAGDKPLSEAKRARFIDAYMRHSSLIMLIYMVHYKGLAAS